MDFGTPILWSHLSQILLCRPLVLPLDSLFSLHQYLSIQEQWNACWNKIWTDPNGRIDSLLEFHWSLHYSPLLNLIQFLHFEYLQTLSTLLTKMAVHQALKYLWFKVQWILMSWVTWQIQIVISVVPLLYGKFLLLNCCMARFALYWEVGDLLAGTGSGDV